MLGRNSSFTNIVAVAVGIFMPVHVKSLYNNREKGASEGHELNPENTFGLIFFHPRFVCLPTLTGMQLFSTLKFSKIKYSLGPLLTSPKT